MNMDCHSKKSENFGNIDLGHWQAGKRRQTGMSQEARIQRAGLTHLAGKTEELAKAFHEKAESLKKKPVQENNQNQPKEKQE